MGLGQDGVGDCCVILFDQLEIMWMGLEEELIEGVGDAGLGVETVVRFIGIDAFMEGGG